MSFVHLHVHSEYSLLDSANRIDELAAAAKEQGMPALALTDHGNLFGAIEFYSACKKAGVKPIIGCELYLAPGSRLEKKARTASEAASHFLVLAYNNEGYRNLLKIVSKAHLEGQYYKPRADRELLQQYGAGLLATSSCLAGEIPRLLLQDQEEIAERTAREFMDLLGPENFYLELHRHNIPEQAKVEAGLLRLRERLGLKLVAANDVHYLKQEDAAAHDVLVCIGKGSQLAEPNRLRYPTTEFYLKTPEQMRQLFADLPEAIENTLEIAERCNVSIELGKNRFPKYPLPEGKTEEGYFRELCHAGVHRRYGARATSPEIQERLHYELGILEKLGFVSYFLIVWDFIDYARRHGIPVGPGRGSAAGSLVAYSLGITDVDPLRYGLVFERFLNPERVSPPDIDVDFCFNRRPEVINYVRQKYGASSVAQIITFGTLGAKGVVRDVARVMGIGYGESDRLSKLIPNDPSMTLEKALEESAEFKQAVESDETFGQLMAYAKRLEGLARHAGVHAAGVVIADGDLMDHVPLTVDDSGGVVTQWAMKPLSSEGSLKMDFLGLKTLTVIQDCLNLISTSTGKPLTIEGLPIDDDKSYRLMARAENVGVFQLESAGMGKACAQVQPQCLEDIIALVALYRPGPMDQIPVYGRRKQGKEPVEYPHPLLEPILKETYGIIIYQEQVMQAAQVLAGYTLGGADLLRRAMGKKSPEEMAKQRSIFVKGCAERNQIPERDANELFDLLEKFAGYGFNKSHAACYGYLAYVTAYLKANYPVEFLCALMTNDAGNTEKIALYIEEARRLNVPVLPPDVNRSALFFSIESGAIRYGLAAIKNVGEAVMREVLAAREQAGRFASLSELCCATSSRALNRKLLESLIKAGACDSFGTSRLELTKQIDHAISEAATQAKEKASGQGGLFAMEELMAPTKSKGATRKNGAPASVPEEWSPRERLAYEKELLGVYFSGHPLEGDLPELRKFQLSTVDRLEQFADGNVTRLAGMVTKFEVTLANKDKRPMARLQLMDQTGTVEAVIFPDTYGQVQHNFKLGDLAVLTGSVSTRDSQPSMRVNQLLTIEEARVQLAGGIILQIDLDAWSSEKWLALHDLVLAHHGSGELRFRCRRGEKVSELVAKDIYHINLTGGFIPAVEQLLGGAHHEVIPSRELPRNRGRAASGTGKGAGWVRS